MPRIPRMIRTDPGQKTVSHVISRTALNGLPFKHAEKDESGTSGQARYAFFIIIRY